MSITLSKLLLPQTVEGFGEQARVLTFLLGLIALLLSLGFFIGDGNQSTNYSLLFDLLSPKIWAVLFGIYGGIKVYQAFDKLPGYLRIITSIIGTWIWIYVFLSFVVFDQYPISPAELLILIPLACEAWELVLDIFNFKCRLGKRNLSV